MLYIIFILLALKLNNMQQITACYIFVRLSEHLGQQGPKVVRLTRGSTVEANAHRISLCFYKKICMQTIQIFKSLLNTLT